MEAPSAKFHPDCYSTLIILADFFLGSHTCNFNSLTTHVNEQLVCLLPVEILNAVMFPWEGEEY